MTATEVSVEQALDDPPVDVDLPTRARIERFAPWVVVAVVPVLLQLIYGVDDVGLVEEWGIQLRFDQIGPVFWTPSDKLGLAAQSIRPLTVVPHAFAYLIDPDSFLGYHLMQSLGLGLRSVAMYLLLLKLRFTRSTAVAAAVIFAVFPAWFGLFSFRTLHMQFTMAALVFAMAQLIQFTREQRWTTGVLIGLSLGISLMMYEAGYVLVFLAPLPLLLEWRTRRRVVITTMAVWYAVPLVNGLRIIELMRSGEPLYQEAILDTRRRAPLHEFIDLVELVLRGGFRWIVDPPYGWAFPPLAVLALVLVVATVCWCAGRTDDTLDGFDRRRMVALGAFALISTPLSALTYWPQLAHLTDPLRVFSVASIPLAIVLACIIELLRRTDRTRIAAVVVACALASASVVSAAGQRSVWNTYSTVEGNLLGAVIATAEPTGTASVVVLDPEHIIDADVYHFIPEYFNIAYDYLLPGFQTARICHGTVDQLAAGTSSDCTLTTTTVETSLGSAPRDGSIFVEIRRTATGPGWVDQPVTINGRAGALVSCMRDATCDDGASGVQARIVELAAP